jgi:hypothetical protein
MLIRADESAVGAINRPLQVDDQGCILKGNTLAVTWFVENHILNELFPFLRLFLQGYCYHLFIGA